MRGPAAVRFLYGDMTGSPVPKMLVASKLCPDRRIDCCAARGRWHHDQPHRNRALAPAVEQAQFSRRSLLGAALTVAGTASWAPLAQATPAHTFKYGAFEITVLSDGNLVLPTPFLAVGTDRKQLDAALADAGQSGDRVEPPCNVTLVRTASEVILIDTGAGPHYMPTAGKLLANLEAAGIARDAVTKVVFTHAHPDHIWGTLDEFDDAPNFPNATYVIAENEWNFWMGPDVAAKMPVHRQFFIPGAKRNLSQIKDRLETIKPGTDIVSGVRTINTAGHTPGHIAIEVASGNDAMLVVGDAIAHPTIAFAHPDWKPDADHDADRAVATRTSLLDRLAADRSRIIGYHLPFPGIGKVERKGTAYAYVSGG